MYILSIFCFYVEVGYLIEKVQDFILSLKIFKFEVVKFFESSIFFNN